MTATEHVVVVGAGVIGLTTAIEAIKKGHQVTVVAGHLPGYQGIEYTSAAAGAHHVSNAGADRRQRAMDDATFKVFWEMSEPDSPAQHCFLRQPQLEYFVEKKTADENCLVTMPNYRELPASDLPAGVEQGATFDTLTIDTPRYLPYLSNLFQSMGGRIVQQQIQHISQLQPPIVPQPVSVIIVCAGIGARYLGGVEDKDVYPIRGQTVLVRAPHITFGRTMSSKNGTWTYIIPRRSGDVVLGGYKTDNDWTSTPQAWQTTEILRRCLKLCPELVPVDRRANPAEPTIDELRKSVIQEGCGLRPARKGGVRIGWEMSSMFERPTAVLYNYGHGGAGYQSSWGSAALCMDQLDKAVASLERARSHASRL